MNFSGTYLVLCLDLLVARQAIQVLQQGKQACFFVEFPKIIYIISSQMLYHDAVPNHHAAAEIDLILIVNPAAEIDERIDCEVSSCFSGFHSYREVHLPPLSTLLSRLEFYAHHEPNEAFTWSVHSCLSRSFHIHLIS